MKKISFLVAGAFAMSAALNAQTIISPICNSISLPAPRGGTANSPSSSLVQAVPEQGTGPYEYWGAGGSATASTHTTSSAGLPVTLIVAPPATNAIPLGAAGSVDIDLANIQFVLYDGIGLLGAPDGAMSPLTIPYGLPTGISSYLASAQGVSLDPTSPVGFYMTGRNDICVQDLATPLAAPLVPPFQVPAGVAPMTPSTSTVYPFPRDTICPNIGLASTAPGANDGTVHSMLGTNFDSTLPGSTTATLNGLPLDVFCVRPNEVIFFTNATHISSIAGPVIVTSTGGTYTPPADQHNSWVHIIPAPLSTLPTEVAGGGGAVVSGTLSGAAGMQAVIGLRSAAGEVDYWDATAMPGGSTVRAFLGQIDLVSGQVLTQCSGLPSTPAARCDVCAITGDGQFSQQWFANACPTAILPPTAPVGSNLRADMWLHQGIGAPGAPSLGVFVADFDDSASGTNAFAGFSGIPSPATQNNLDPDGPITTLGGGSDFLVSDEFANPTAPLSGYNYIMIVNR